jgi:ABC-2 type transport system permease protein
MSVLRAVDMPVVRVRSRLGEFLAEATKVNAFLRRDFLVAWSYRMSFVSNIAGMFVQAITFYFVGRMVNNNVLPTYGGEPVTYMEFAAIGIAFGGFLSLGLGQVATAVRQEQLMGTLESLLMTPTSTATIQVGSVAYQLLFVPLRTGIFLGLIAFAFGLQFDADGIAPAALVFLLFVPCIWGLGLLSAAGVMTFKRGGAGVGLGVTLLVLASGAYFPLDLLPEWAQQIAQLNPLAIAIGGVREALLGGSGWHSLSADVLLLVPIGAAALAAGLTAFRRAVQREHARGTIGLY